MTELVFRDDAYLKACGAIVIRIDERGVQLDRTVFYPTGGGQPGDVGVLRSAAGDIAIAGTIKGNADADAPDTVIHVPAPGARTPDIGEKVVALICDNQLFVKPTAAGREVIGSPAEVPPYKGAKPFFLVGGELDDTGFLTRLILATESEVPRPKSKVRRNPKTGTNAVVALHDATCEISAGQQIALMGQSGSGKSTVIDAICFALYGTIPRYDDRRAVGAAVNALATEARVSLTFASWMTVTFVPRALSASASSVERCASELFIATKSTLSFVFGAQPAAGAAGACGVAGRVGVEGCVGVVVGARGMSPMRDVMVGSLRERRGSVRRFLRPTQALGGVTFSSIHEWIARVRALTQGGQPRSPAGEP